MSITLKSTAFENGGMIPSRYTCDGQDISPPLQWSGIPPGTASIALISDDPDAPVGTWVHWVIFNVPPEKGRLPEELPPENVFSDGTTQGRNDFRRIGYGGPCPPGGTHRYFFKIYALDTRLGLKPGATKSDLLRAMKGHILDTGELMGRYSRRR